MDWRIESLGDIAKQGFMRGRKPSKPKKARVVISCALCRDWHWEGKHSKTAAERKAIAVERKHAERIARLGQSL